MTELYDQDLEPKSGGSVKRSLAIALAFVLVAGAAGYAYGYLSPFSQAPVTAPADLDVGSYLTQSVSWESCSEDSILPADWQSKNFDAD